ncbi:A24 family peptidase [Microbacterium sp. zg.Y625]|uniref:prepilin peptidase n=1 Tax=Microbacterium jiangjiandongii TaxID=3049071 RepID=UPI00214AB8B1|nr:MULTISPECIES: A24 family peptidase [unclassified Microbacterium]MCR2792428.1 A24 family peptidase [Microbacterium sp. zg.Y625]WIM26423.1 A24 family peptidase [Microbacterium sp. zg-Y625]
MSGLRVTWEAMPLVVAPVALAYALFAAGSVWLAVVDLRDHRLPNALVLPLYPLILVLFAVAALAGGDAAPLLRSLLGGGVLFLLYAALRALGGGVGGGDVKLAGVVGVVLGHTGWAAVLTGTAAAFVLGGVVALGLLATGRATRTTRIAFGPYLLGGAWLALAASIAA